MRNLIDVTLKQKIKMKNFCRILLNVSLFLSANVAWGQIAAWEMSGLSNFGPSPYAASTTHPNVTVGGLTRGSGVGTTGTGAMNAWGGNNFTETSLADAITGNDFATFTITPNAGYTMSLSSISAYNIRRSDTGPTTGQWQYRVGSGSFINIGSSITWGPITTAAGNPQSSIDLSSITDLQNISAGTTITFRIVTWGGTHPDGTWYINNIVGNDLEINGTVVSPGFQLQHPISTNVSCGFTMNFGSPNVGTDTDLELRILNTGSDDIDINSFTALSAPYSFVSLPSLPLTLAPTQFVDVTIRFSPTATGTFPSSFTINYDDGSPKTCVVNLSGAGITPPPGSDIIVEPTFIYPTNIPYINYQTTDITPANIGISSIEITRFTIRDGGATAPDADALPTILNNLNFSVMTCGAIRRLAIYDGSTEIQEITPACAFANFSGLNLTAPDNGTKTFRVIASFVASPITDKSQIRLTVTSATVGAGSSTFGATNAGGAQTSIAGDNNRLNVTADRLAFVQNTSNVGVNATMTPFPTVEARDANGNRDIDFTGVISITSTGTMDATPKTATATSGLATFSNILHTATATARTLTATATGLTGTTSGLFDILNQTIFKPGDLVFIAFDASVASSSDDDVYFMTMVDILPGTNFSYVNSRFEAGATACTRTMRWGGPGNNPNTNPGILKFVYNGSAPIASGSIIRFRTTGNSVSEISVNGGPNIVGSFIIANPGTALANIATGEPDQMWLVQGDFINLNTTNVQLNGTVLYGMTMGVGWIPFSSACSGANAGGTARQSRLHPDIECFNFSNTSTLQYAYYNIGALHIGTKRQLLQSIANLSNWTTSTSPGAPPSARETTTFTINPSNPEGTWVGDASVNPNDWFTCGNWEGLAVPDEDIDVVIPNVTNWPRIDVDGYSVGCAGAYTSTKYGGYAKAKSVTINGETLEFGNGASNNGSTADRLDIFGNLTITNTAGGNLDMDAGTSPQDGTINLQGNWINNLGTVTSFAEGNSHIRFVGTTPQTITTAGGSETFHNITFNNTSGISLNSTNALVSGTATFTAGIVNAPNATTARMEFLAGSSHTGASATSHVQGWVRKVGNDDFTFPVGDGTFYAPIGITAPANTTDHFTATYNRVYPNPYNILSKVPSLDHVGNCEHWILDRTGGTSNVQVELSYDNVRSCGITAGSEPDLRVARWDGAIWQNEGGTVAGIGIRSNIVTSFSPFTLASTTSAHPLPVELISFRGFVTTKGEAQLIWQVAAQINIKGYAVEKSLDNKNFEQIGFVDAQNLTTYNFFDAKFTELSYYRLRIVENDGSYRYSQVVSLDKNKTLTAQLLIYPNPAGEQDDIRVMIGGRDLASKLQAVVYGQSGKVLGEINASLQETESQLSQLLATQPKGLYIIYLQTEDGETLTTKFVKK